MEKSASKLLTLRCGIVVIIQDTHSSTADCNETKSGGKCTTAILGRLEKASKQSPDVVSHA
jgi:hypothetical protein